MKRSDFDKLEQELTSTHLISRVTVYVEPPATGGVDDLCRGLFPFAAKRGLLSIFAKANGLRLLWHCDAAARLEGPASQGAAFVGGEADIRGCLETFSSDSGAVLGCDIAGGRADDDQEMDRYAEFCREMVVIDRYSEAFQATRATTAQIRKGRFQQLWFWDSDGDKYPLALTPAEYLPRLIQAKAMLNWQYFYIDVAAMNLSDPFFGRYVYGTTLLSTIETMEAFCGSRARLFGRSGIDHYEKKLAHLRDRLLR